MADTRRIRPLVFAALLAVLLTLVLTIAANRDRGSDELGTIGDWRGTYVPHAWVNTVQSEEFITRMVEDLQSSGFQYQIHNIGFLDDEGVIPSEEFRGLEQWLRVSREVDPNQRIILWINGDEEVHVNNVDLHGNIAGHVRELVEEHHPYGIWFDFEPFSEDNLLYLDLLRTIDAEAPGAWLAVNAPVTREWSNKYIGEVARIVNAISPMYYDSDLTEADEYIDWVRYNTRRYIHAMDGAAAHIASIPAYRANQFHDPAIENIINAVQGLELSGRNSEGVAVYLWHQFDAAARSQWQETERR